MKPIVIKNGKRYEDVWCINFKDNSTTQNQYVIYTEDTDLGKEVKVSNWPDEVEIKMDNLIKFVEKKYED